MNEQFTLQPYEKPDGWPRDSTDSTPEPVDDYAGAFKQPEIDPASTPPPMGDEVLEPAKVYSTTPEPLTDDNQIANMPTLSGGEGRPNNEGSNGAGVEFTILGQAPRPQTLELHGPGI